MEQIERMCYNWLEELRGVGTMAIEDGAWIMRGLDSVSYTHLTLPTIGLV